MSVLRRTRSELAGAWRSVRYDMGRREVEPERGGPDVTSTGMCTFGGPIVVEFQSAEPAPVPHRAPRRAAAVTAFGVLTVVGAAGAYLGVVNGLGPLLDGKPAAADTFPAPAVTSTFTPNAGIGRGPAPRTVATTPPATVGEPTVTPAAPAAANANVPVSTRNMSPIRSTKPTSREAHPPVPTPTAPASAPTPTPSSSPSAGNSASPSPSESSATPGETVEPSESPDGKRGRWHR